MKTSTILLCSSLLLLLSYATLANADKKFPLAGASGSGPYEALTDLASAFEAKHPEVDLSVSSVGTGATQSALWGDLNCEKKWIDGVCPEGDPLNSDKTVFGMGGSPLKSEDKEEHSELGLEIIPAFGGPVLVVYSKDVTGELGLDTAAQLNMSYSSIAGIFNGSIDTWNHAQLQAENPELELPEERITVLVRSDKSGMSEVLTEFLQHTNPETWPEEAVGSTPDWQQAGLTNITDLSESSSVQDDTPLHWKGDGQTGIGIGLLRRPFSIGYMELGYFNTLTSFVAQAHVSGPGKTSSFEPATVETLRTTMAGLSSKLDPEKDLTINMFLENTPLGGYPISRYVYWYIKQSALNYESCYQAWLFVTFVTWVYTDELAEEISLSHGWVIPPAPVVTKALEVLDRIQCTVVEGEQDKRAGEEVGDTISAVSFVPPPYREPEVDSDVTLLVVVVVLISVLILFLVGFAIFHILQLKKAEREADTFWIVKRSEVQFGSPPQVIGQGTFGTVILGTFRGTDVAVKRALPQSLRGDSTLSRSGSFGYSNSSMDSSESSVSLGAGSFVSTVKASSFCQLKADFLAEMRLLSKLRHPCITMIMGAVVNNPEPLLIMELCNYGSLYDILHNKTASLDGDLLLPILLDISQGVLFLHSASPPVIHADLKAQNILVDSKFRAKVADFGLSAKGTLGVRGTRSHMAPELLLEQSTNTAASDVFALGVIFYEIYSRKEPYEEEEDFELVRREVADPAINRRPVIPPSCPPELVSLMKECWQTNPEKRPPMNEIDTRLKRFDVENADPGGMPTDKGTRSEELLYKVFPKHIADALRDGKKVEPEHHDCVSIFFSDIVGFTTIATKLSAAKVSEMLDRLYERFDALSFKHDVFKIETIGDAYLGVTNLVSKQDEDHVKRIAEFSLDAIQAARETLIDTENPDMGCVNIRVGFHSGPVIASVVGTRLPKFSMFGDTINTASRMESNSEAGRILCSKESAELLMEQAPAMLLIPRGEMNIKGKGKMETFFVDQGTGCQVQNATVSTEETLSTSAGSDFEV